MDPIFSKSGKHIGQLQDNRIVDNEGAVIGVVAKNSVYASSSEYVGQLEGNRIVDRGYPFTPIAGFASLKSDGEAERAFE
jgi:sporulation protein YlmC with PRC-barrel domain